MLIFPSVLLSQVVDTAIVKGRHIVVEELGNQEMMELPTRDPKTDILFEKYTLEQIILILEKTRERIEFSAAEEKRLAEILNENNERFINTFKRSDVLDEIIIRQAEIQYEVTQDNFFAETEVYNKKLNAYFENLERFEAGEIQERPVQPTEPVKEFSKVIGLYDYIINEIPESRYVSDALYNKAYILGQDMANPDQGVRTLEILIRKYPTSKYVMEANWLIGEFLFNSPDSFKLRRARSHYQKVLELAAESEYPTKRYQESLYRLAWVSYKLREFTDAIAYFTFLLDDIEQNRQLFEGQPNPSFFKPEMYDEAAQYIGVCFMDLEKLEDAPEQNWTLNKVTNYMAKFNPPKRYEPWVYEQLGNSFQDIDEYEKAIAVNQYLLEKYPNSERSPYLAKEIIDLREREINALDGLAALTARESVYKLKMDYFNNYNYRSDWYRIQLQKFYAQTGPNPDITVRGVVDRFINSDMFTEVDSISQAYFINNVDLDIFYALAFNGDQRQEGVPSDKEEALKYFDRFADNVSRYVSMYSKYDSVGYENSYRLALVLDQYLKQPSEAYPYWVDVSRNPYSERYRFEAASNAISIATDELKSYEEANPRLKLSSLERAQAIVPDSILSDINFLAYVDTLSMTLSERRLVESYDNFARLYPHIDKSVEFLENAKLIYFNKNHLDRVADIQIILQKYYPGKAIDAGYVTDLMQGYYFVKDYPTSEKLAKAVVQMENATKEQKDFALNIWATSIGNYAKILQDRKDYLAAAQQYYRIYEELPEYDKVATAIYNAAINYDNLKEYNKSIELYNLIIDKYPEETQLVEDSHKNIYANYFEMKAFASASKQMERMFYAYRDNDELADAYLKNAYADAIEAGDKAEAIRLAGLYVDNFPASPEAAGILFGTIALNEELGDEKGKFDAYGRFAAEYPNDQKTVEAFYRRALYLEKDGQTFEALQEFELAAQRNRELKEKGLTSNPYYAAESLVRLGTELRDDFDAISWDFDTYETQLQVKENAKQAYWDNQLEIRNLSFEPGGNFYRAIEAMYNIAETQEIVSVMVANRDAAEAGYLGDDQVLKQNDVYNDAQSYYKTAYDIYYQTLTSYQQYNEQILALEAKAETDSSIVIPDSTVALLAKNDSIVSNKTAEMLYKSAKARHDVVYLFLDNDAVLSQFDDPNVYLLAAAQLIEEVSLDIQDAIVLYKNNIDLSAEIEVENMWVQKSREDIVELSDLKARRYQDLVNYALNAFDDLFVEFRNVVERDDEPASDDIFQSEARVIYSIDNTKNYVSQAINEFANALQTVDANELGKDLRLQVENNTTKFLLDAGIANLNRANSMVPVKRQYEKVYSDTNFEKYWYFDGASSIENIIFTLRTSGLEILNSGILFMDNFGVFTSYTGQILTQLIATDPATYGPLLGDIDLRTSITIETDNDWRATLAPESDLWYTTAFSDSSWSYASENQSSSGLQVDYTDNYFGPKSTVIQPVWFYGEEEYEEIILEVEPDKPSEPELNQFQDPLFEEGSISDSVSVPPADNIESVQDSIENTSSSPIDPLSEDNLDEAPETPSQDDLEQSTVDPLQDDFIEQEVDSLNNKRMKFIFNGTNPDTTEEGDQLEGQVEPVTEIEETESDLSGFETEAVNSDTTFVQPEYQPEFIEDTTSAPVEAESFTPVLSTSTPAGSILVNKARIVEKPDNLETIEIPEEIYLRKTFTIGGQVNVAQLIVGKNLETDVYVNGTTLDNSLARQDFNGNAYIHDITTFVNRGKNVIAMRANGQDVYNKSVYALLNLVYYPVIPSEKILRIFKKNREAMGMIMREEGSSDSLSVDVDSTETGSDTLENNQNESNQPDELGSPQDNIENNGSGDALQPEDINETLNESGQANINHNTEISVVQQSLFGKDIIHDREKLV